MRLKIFFLSLIFATLGTYAQDDLTPVKIQPAPLLIPEFPVTLAVEANGIGICKTIDLSAPGGPLATIRTTNQGPYGICHIEQLSRMLKAKMPGAPNFARISMAMQEKEARDKNLPNEKKKAITWVDSEKVPRGIYFNAGNSCEAFELLKDAELCDLKGDLFENVTKMYMKDQKKFLDALMIYFDERAQKPGSSKSVISILNALEKDVQFAALECRGDLNFTSKFAEAYTEIGGKAETKNLYLPIEARQYFKTTNMEEYLKSILPDIDSVLKANPQFMTFYTSFLAGLRSQDDCIRKQLKDAKNVCALGDDKPIKNILDLSDMGFTGRDLYRFLNLTPNRDQYFAKVRQCPGKSYKIPKNLKCTETGLGTLAKRADYVDQFSKILEDKLKSGTPIGISICTRFFKNPKAVSEMTTLKENNCGDKNSPFYDKEEGGHAVTVIAKRCNQDGVTEYLVHNSWGGSCVDYSPEYDCNGKGGVWIPVNILAKNTKMLSILE